jgi:hypothetical protein
MKSNLITRLVIFMICSGAGNLLPGAESATNSPTQQVGKHYGAGVYGASKPVHEWIALQAWRLLPAGAAMSQEFARFMPASENSACYVSFGTFLNNSDLGLKWQASGSSFGPPETALVEGTFDEDFVSASTFWSEKDGHYWNPAAGYRAGYGAHTSALEDAQGHFATALRYYQANELAAAYYWLGHAAHLLQDMAVPAHSLLDEHVFQGDDSYEKYADGHYREYGAEQAPASPLLILDYPHQDLPPGADRELAALFYSLAAYSAQFDSDDANGASQAYGHGKYNTARIPGSGGSLPENKTISRVEFHSSVPVVDRALSPGSDYALEHNAQEYRIYLKRAFWNSLFSANSVLGVESLAFFKTGVFNFTFYYTDGTRESRGDVELAMGDSIINHDLFPDVLARIYLPSLEPRAIELTAKLFQLFWKRTHASAGEVTVSLAGAGPADLNALILYQNGVEIMRHDADQTSSPLDLKFGGISEGTGYAIQACAWDMWLGQTEVFSQAPSAQSKTIPALPKRNLAIQVLDQATSRPLSGLRVSLCSWDGYRKEQHLRDTRMTDANGQATFQAWPTTQPGERYIARVYAGSLEVWINENITLANASSTAQYVARVNPAQPAGEATASWADSSITTVDTRSKKTVPVTGYAVDEKSGLPVAGAQVSIGQLNLKTATLSNGAFTLNEVPPFSDYTLSIAADGYRTRTEPVAVKSLVAVNLGILRLASAGRPYQIMALNPDVNPSITTVEAGGTAYRYYRVVAADGRTPVGQVRVTVRVAGQPEIPQTETVKGDWAGQVAGLTDEDGLLRVRVPAERVGAPGGRQPVEVVEDGQVKATFMAQVLPRNQDRVWRHEVGSELSGKVAAVAVQKNQAFAVEILRPLNETKEYITRNPSREYRAGIDLGAGVKFGAGADYEVGAGGYINSELNVTYRFLADSQGPEENAMKLFLTLGDTILSLPGSAVPGLGFYDFGRKDLEPLFLADRLYSSGGALHLGGYAGASGLLGFKSSQEVTIGAAAELSLEAEGLVGAETQFLDAPESSFFMGVAARGQAVAQIGLRFGKSAQAENRNSLGYSLFDFDGEVTFLGRIILSPESAQPRRLEIEQRAKVAQNPPLMPNGWKIYAPTGGQNPLVCEFTEVCSLELPNAQVFARLAATAPLWGLLNSGGRGSVVTIDQPAAMWASVLQTAMNSGLVLDYRRTVYAAEQRNLDFEIGLDALIAGLGVGINGEIERGVQTVNERGRIWQFRRMVLESYPALTAAQIPQESILDIERRWALNAAAPLAAALKQVAHQVEQAKDTVIQAGKNGLEAILTVGQGAMEAGATIISQWKSGLDSGPGGRLHSAGSAPFLPPPGASNYVYGVGGIYQFETTNRITAPIRLSLAYPDQDISGLSEMDLRVYRLAPGLNQWQLVGGTVDAAANRVRVSVTNLGMFALAPPLPAGPLQLKTGATNALPADGVSLLTVTATNLLLNTGLTATQAWLFTVETEALELLNPDADPTRPGRQVASTNGVLALVCKAPKGGSTGRLSASSVAGSASGSLTVNLVDNQAPATPQALVARPGQSRLWVSWAPNAESDLAGYRVYYRAEVDGPPYDGTALVDGSPSPVSVSGTNCALPGMELDRDYYVAVSALDQSGNESPLSPAVKVRTRDLAPEPPLSAAAQLGTNGVPVLMWSASPDDGANDRDVTAYTISCRLLPENRVVPIATVPPGIGMHVATTNVPARSTGEMVFEVSAVDRSGYYSQPTPAVWVLASVNNLDSDNDGLPDDWELAHRLNPRDPSDALADGDGDGLTNLEEFLAGTDPQDPASGLFITRAERDGNGWAIEFASVPGKFYRVEKAFSLSGAGWAPVGDDLSGTGGALRVIDRDEALGGQGFYRVRLLPPASGNPGAPGVSSKN